MIGQRCVQQQIKAEIENRSLARFIILVGDKGSGRKTLAKEIAKLTDSEYVVVDKGVDAVREVIEQAYTVSANVLYVLDYDTMSNASRSAILKVTEEPPNKARFVLIVTDLTSTLSTLVSRAWSFRMDNYTDTDIAYFAGTEDVRFPNFCANKYEVDLLKGYGIDEFADFVNVVVANIAEVESANALKMEEKIAFKEEPDKYDVKIFLQAFRTVCMSKIQESESYYDKLKYIQWVSITTQKLSLLRVNSLNRQALFDMWIFDIRRVALDANY